MNRLRKCFVVGVLVTAAIGLLAVAAAEEATFVLPENLPPLQTPILVTTCGQSPGALMFTLICNHLGLDCTEMDLLTLAEFQSQCDPSQPTQWAKVLVITTGTRLKGMGAAGVDVDSEVARCLGLIAEAKAQGMVVIVAQIEGIARRVDEYDEKSIESMSPLADLSSRARTSTAMGTSQRSRRRKASRRSSSTRRLICRCSCHSSLQP